MMDLVATIRKNQIECNDYWRLTLHLPAQEKIQPGQFVMIRAHGQIEPILRRAFVYYRLEQGVGLTEAEFIYQVLGRGTGQLARLRAGDRVDLLGPLGNGFPIDPLPKSSDGVALVSGGVGAPALYLLAQALTACGIPTRLFHGDRTSDPVHGLICSRDFDELLGSKRTVYATEDGSIGVRGFVTVPLEHAVRSEGYRPSAMYACGPRPMMRRVGELARELDIPAYLSLESRMACGFGVCLACAERLQVNGQETYVRVCAEGPVFRADEVLWDT